MKKRIAGVVVSPAVAEEYEKREYLVTNGVYTDLNTIQFSLDVLHFKEQNRYSFINKEWCLKCWEIYDKVRADLLKYNFSKGLNEDGEHTHNILCGIACSDRVYEEFANKKYIVPGVDYEEPLYRIEKEYTKKKDSIDIWGKEKVAKYEQVIKGARKEIKEYMKSIGEEEITMSKDNSKFTNYLKRNRALYEGAALEILKLRQDLEKSEEQFKDFQRKHEARNDSEFLIEQGKMYEKKRDTQKKIEELIDQANVDSAALKEDYEKELNSFYCATPDKLDANLLTLVNSGILSADELVNLAEKNLSNPTMARFICKKAEEIDEQKARALVYKIRDNIGGRKEVECFDSLTFWGEKLLNGAKDGTHSMWAPAYDKTYNQIVEAVEAIPFKPDEE